MKLLFRNLYLGGKTKEKEVIVIKVSAVFPLQWGEEVVPEKSGAGVFPVLTMVTPCLLHNN